MKAVTHEDFSLSLSTQEAMQGRTGSWRICTGGTKGGKILEPYDGRVTGSLLRSRF